MLELVIFDADGVLFDSTVSNVAYYNTVLDAVGEPRLDPEEERAAVYMAADEVFALRARGDEELRRRMLELARTIDFTPFFDLMRPAPGLKRLVLRLSKRFRVALATNRSATVGPLVEYLGLDGVFDPVVGVSRTLRPKPAPDILIECLKRTGVEAKTAVYVGDSAIDLAAAAAAGIGFVAVGPRVAHRDRVDSLRELPALLNRRYAVSNGAPHRRVPVTGGPLSRGRRGNGATRRRTP